MDIIVYVYLYQIRTSFLNTLRYVFEQIDFEYLVAILHSDADPQSAAAYHLRATLFLKKKLTSKALDDLNKALQFDPQYGPVGLLPSFIFYTKLLEDIYITKF